MTLMTLTSPLQHHCDKMFPKYVICDRMTLPAAEWADFLLALLEYWIGDSFCSVWDDQKAFWISQHHVDVELNTIFSTLQKLPKTCVAFSWELFFTIDWLKRGFEWGEYVFSLMGFMSFHESSCFLFVLCICACTLKLFFLFERENKNLFFISPEWSHDRIVSLSFLFFPRSLHPVLLYTKYSIYSIF